MSLQFREQLDSRSKTPQRGGRILGRRMFKVWDDAGASVDPDEALIIVGIDLYDTWPDDPSLIAIRPGEMRRVEGHRDLVELAWHYENISPVPPGTPRQDEVGYVEVNSDHRRELVKLYRVGPSPPLIFPDFGTITSEWITQDIDGTVNDIRGHRETSLIYRVSLVITEIIEGPVDLGMLGRDFASRRNSTPFFGSAVGKIVYAGPKSRTIRLNTTAVTHHFFYDEFFHMVQIADRDQSGNIKLQTFEPEPGEDPLTVAARVYWRQPFAILADFHDISIYFDPPP